MKIINIIIKDLKIILSDKKSSCDNDTHAYNFNDDIEFSFKEYHS